MWFTEIASIPNPGREEIHKFLDGVLDFLGFVLEPQDFDFLWEDDPELQALATETYSGDVRESARDLHRAIPNIPESSLMSHGLVGRPMRIKFRVLASVSDNWERVRGQFSIRGWFKRVIDAIDAILESLLDAAGGIGGIIKEFKDALSALAKTIE
jgi:hypothetical protein